MTEAENKMKASVEHAREEFGAIRTGRAHPAMFNKILVDYYGAPTPLQQLATFQVPEARVVLVLPQLTEERRKEYIKVARHKAEEARVAIRANRRHAVDAVRKLEKAKEVGEDEAVRADKQLDAVTKRYEEQVNELLKAKEAELLEV